MRHAPLPASVDAAGAAEDASEDAPLVSQIGYAIGKNVGNAVVRNRIRRRLRPIVAAEAPTLAPGLYLIGVKSDEAARIPYEELQKDLQQLLSGASAARRAS